jgi:RimJ/RimL family protein N-acetyltransferase
VPVEVRGPASGRRRSTRKRFRGGRSINQVHEQVITCLEMTAPTQLRPGRPSPAPIEMEKIGRAEAHLVRSTYVRIWERLASRGRIAWSAADWEQELLRPGVEAWLARVGGEIAGFVELEAEPDGSVGIVVFGLVPEFQGRGFGSEFLTRATRLAWNIPGAQRVWLQTSSGDHPHAIRNYQARGFRGFKTQRIATGSSVVDADGGAGC